MWLFIFVVLTASIIIDRQNLCYATQLRDTVLHNRHKKESLHDDPVESDGIISLLQLPTATNNYKFINDNNDNIKIIDTKNQAKLPTYQKTNQQQERRHKRTRNLAKNRHEIKKLIDSIFTATADSSSTIISSSSLPSNVPSTKPLESFVHTDSIQSDIPSSNPSSNPSSSPLSSNEDKEATTTTTTDSSSSSSLLCGCQSCTQDVWDRVVQSYSCGSRIEYLANSEQNLYPTIEDACVRIASIEYPNECGACNPLSCDGKQPSDSNNNQREYYCGCKKCTNERFKMDSGAGDELSCEARITWVQSHNPLYANENDACKLIAVQLPNTCGLYCNPTTCRDTHSLTTTTTNNNNNNSSNNSSNSNNNNNNNSNAPRNPTSRPIQQTSDSDNGTPDDSTTSSQIYAPLGTSILGPNVWIIDSNKMTIAEIQGALDDLYYRQVHNEMGEERYAVYFVPGVYGSVNNPLYIKIGYYTDLAGLGTVPGDVVIYGKIEVYNRCFVPDQYRIGKFVPFNGDSGMCFALNNFWRSLSNIAIQIVSVNQDECRQTAMFWAVSQATSMRRVDIRGGDVSLMDYCSRPGYASGGFIANTQAGKIISGSQQQFFTRNSNIRIWDGSVWNIMFMGVNGAPDGSQYPNPPFTTLDTVPISREKPYLSYSNGTFIIHVADIQQNTNGITWDDATSSRESGRIIPISDFLLIDTTTTSSQLQAATNSGKNLLFLPGVHLIDQPITITEPNTVVLGIGIATLTAVNGVTPIVVSDVPGVIIAGLIIDAGDVQSKVLLQVGQVDSSSSSTDPNNPTTLSDVYFRVGGPHIGKADISLEINSNDVLLDHTWVWRADHGIENFTSTDGFEGDNERWKTNIGRNGVVVNGNDIIAMGFFVEHYQEHNVVWNGERGKVYLFQCETPYDPPTQEDWTNTVDGTLGWAGYKVNGSVTEHELWAGGVYCYNRNNPSIQTQNGFEAPIDKPGIQLNRLFTRNLSGPGAINAVVNGIGDPATEESPGPHYILSAN